MWYMWLWWWCLQWNQLVLVKWLGVKVILLVWICCAKASIVHAVCCGCLLKRNVDVIWKTKPLLQKLSHNLSRCTDVARWADRFEKIPICQISTATSGPDSPSTPTEISLAGGRMRIHFRISGEVLVVLRGGCWKKSIISDKIWNNNGSHEDAEEVLTVLREGCWIILRFVGWLPEYDQLMRMLWNQI